MSGDVSRDEEAQPEESSLLADLFGMLAEHRKWWLLPLLALIGFVGILVLAGASPLSPFIYSLF